MSVKRLLHNMQMKGIPKEYTDWLERKYRGRTTIMVFDDFISEWLNVSHGAIRDVHCQHWDTFSIMSS
jgi:hypothetical protein